jgi:hypothetical protein
LRVKNESAMTKREDAIYIGLGLAIGAGVGTALGSVVGSVTGDLALWVAMGPSIGAAVGLAIGAGLMARREETAAMEGKCERCGYSLEGLKGGVCPECGAAV